MKRFYALAMGSLAVLIVVAIVLRLLSGFVVFSFGVVALIAIVIVLFGLLSWTVLFKTHRLIVSAEWELMEMAIRAERGTDSRTKKQDEKLDYFSRLAKETSNIYTAPAQAGGHLFVGALPKPPFNNETMELLQSQHLEMEKMSKRKARVRLNAALLRELLYGASVNFSGYHARLLKLNVEERAMVMGTIEALSKADANMVFMTAKFFRHPSACIAWPPLKLRGKKALEYLCSF